MNSDAIYLPQEIIGNILKRLPVKSLIRFQCVCKLWKNLIENPSFIADHLQQSSHQNPSLLVEYYRIAIPSRLRCHLRLLDCGFQVREVQKAPLIDSLECARIVGSCNGLLLVEIRQNKKYPLSLLLWNPATTAVGHVPTTKTDCFDFCESVIAFGFSPIVNDYMIVRTYGGPVYRGEVFSLRRESWKEIDIENLKRVRLSYENVTVNGAIFWTGVKEGDGKEVKVIISFDIAKEVFTLIPRPFDYDANQVLTVYENKLAILHDIFKDDGLIDLWVLDEGTCASGETWRWAKRYTCSPFSCLFDSMTIWRNEIICQLYLKEDNERGSNVLCLMNLTTDEVRRVVIPCIGPLYSIYNYAESLVPVGNNYIEES